MNVEDIMPRDIQAQSLSHIRLFATPWTVAHQAPLSVGFPRQEYWSRLPFPPPGELPDPGVKLSSPELQANSLPTEPPGRPCRDDMSPLNKHLACVSWERVPMYLTTTTHVNYVS